jgi:hypothetical protein
LREAEALFLLPLREKVAAQRSDEGSIDIERRDQLKGRSRRFSFERPLIRQPSADTFSRKGRRTATIDFF